MANLQLFPLTRKLRSYVLLFTGFTLLSVSVSGQEIRQKTLEDSTNTQKTNSVGNVGIIRSEEIEQEQTVHTTNAVPGRVSGVTSTDGVLLVRGQNTGDKRLSQPLFVIDGMPMPDFFVHSSDSRSSPLNAINASNIEKIEILKDADATAIYGGKGSNGVILITTKKVQEARLRVSAEISAGLTGVTNWYDMLSTEEYLDIRQKAFAADGITPTESNAYDLLLWGDQYHTDWQREFVGKAGKIYSGQLNISGGNNQTTFYINADYYEAGNVYLAENGDKNKRFNSRILVNHSGYGGRLNINASLAFGTFKTTARGLDPDAYVVWAPNQPTRNEDGSIYWLPGNSSFVNPLRYKYVTNINQNTTLLGTFQLRYRIFHELEAKIDVGYARNTSDQFEGFEQNYLNPYAANTYKNRVLAGDSYSEKTNIEPQLNYAKQFGKHTVTALAGATLQIDKAASDDFELRDFPSDALLRNYSAAAVKQSVSGGTFEKRYASLFTRVVYDYNGRYLFNASIRRDGSSIFHKNNRFGNFWSIAGGWIFSKENFVRENLPFLNYGKLRASYGTTGNDNVAAFLFLNAYSTSTYPYNGNAGLYLSRIANPDFGWESTRKLEIALETSFLRDRLQANVAVYRNRSKSLISGVPIALQAGLDGYKSNTPGALIQNQGVEIEITSTNVIIGDFRWLSWFNITIPDYNKLLSFPGIEKTAYNTQWKVGESLNITRLYRYTGINPANGAPTVEDVNEDGKIVATDDKQFLKDTDPDFFGGFQNSFRYKGLQLDVFFTFEKRPFAEGYLKTFYYPAGYIGRNIPRIFVSDYWTPENPNAKYPGLTTSSSSTIGNAYYYHYTESDAVYSDASFICLKNVALSYYLPESIVSKLKIRSARLYLRGENLAWFTKFNQWNPETGTAIPPFKTITAGIRLTF
ncbi:MAG: SusC/RagA family TonB-linked outer membrane protein [Prevotellaceae bacterium]|nr:SusC/RagA family TonB-linked outer membrane protein [Prevotellaceae bacterium]